MPLEDDTSTTSINRVRNLLLYANEKVPYYRQLFHEMHLYPKDILSLENLQQLPLLTKKMIQQNQDNFLSDDYRDDYKANKLIVSSTSGTTGIPLRIIHTRAENMTAGRHFIKARIKSGLSFPARWAILGGLYNVSDSVDNSIRLFQRGTTETMFMSCLDLSEAALQRYILELETFQPTWIYSTPARLDCLAEFIISRGKPANLPNLQLLEASGAYLSLDARDRIQHAFQHAPVSQYSCQEIWLMGFECKQGGMHLISDNVYFEVIKSDGSPALPGEVGKAVVTGLNFRAMPFIRYQLEDLVIPLADKCTCQDRYPLIKIVEGRTEDYIVGRSNLSGSFVFDVIIEHLHKTMKIDRRQHQVIQRSLNDFEIWIACSAPWSEDAQAFLMKRGRQILGEGAIFNFRFVEEIPLSSSGKIKSFIVDIYPTI